MISIRHFFSRTMRGDRKALDRLYREVFAGDDGRRILADLFSRTFFGAPPFASFSGAIDQGKATRPAILSAEELAYFRGQQDLVRMIAEKAGVGNEDAARAFADDDFSKGEDDGDEK